VKESRALIHPDNPSCNPFYDRLSLPREWLGPGGSPGLQNLWRVALRAAVGSTPIHSRLSRAERGETKRSFGKQTRRSLVCVDATIASSPLDAVTFAKVFYVFS
jgi:hypothetical protein